VSVSRHLSVRILRQHSVRHVRTCRQKRRIVRSHGVVDVGCSGTDGGSGGRDGAATRPARQRPGFPWFWVAFPATCIVIATAIGVFAWPQVLTGSGSYWWEPPTANRPGVQFLSSEQYQRFATLHRWRWVLPVASLVGSGWCVWAWRRRRV
jgi:hypothetical protein